VILEFSKGMESFDRAFYSLIKQFRLFLSSFCVQNTVQYHVWRPNLQFSLCATWREILPTPSPSAPTATVNLAPDWLGVELEVMSLCYPSGGSIPEDSVQAAW
jgi:hypothetical protein